MSKAQNSEPGGNNSMGGSEASENAASSAMAEDRSKAAEQQCTPEPRVKYSASPGLTQFLAATGLSFAFTSYQSGRLYLVGRDPKGGLHVNERIFQQAMGLSASARQLYLASLFQITRFENVVPAGHLVNQTHDACYVPRKIHVTGALGAHDIGIGKAGEIVFVNTNYSCLATPSETHSFRMLWKPPYISKLAPEDRCHLNGLAMDQGKPAYVTAISKSDTIDGWRDRRHEGGVLIDVGSDKILLDDLSMPHSPRLHEGKLWLLNSGKGELGHVDRKSKKPAFHPLAFCPGFLRGLAFHKNFAFVGLSKPRYERFEGLELDQRLQEKDADPWCGVQIIDLNTGNVVQWFRIDGAVSELYDVAVIPGVRTPMSLGFQSGEIVNFITVEE